jgi:type II secretory pathway pseudopilin PulG
MRIAPHRRPAFTLIELLVVCALSILIMAIMATAFSTGLGTLGQLKAIGDLAERSKTATVALRADLQSDHFANADDSPAPLRLSDLNSPFKPGTPAPKGGYFQIFQGLPSFDEGPDADGNRSSRAGAPENHRLSMTVVRRGNASDRYFSADVSLLSPAERAGIDPQSVADLGVPNRLVSRWAQVDWFLDANRPAPFVTPLGTTVTTWPLIRRVRVMGTTATPITSASPATDALSITPAGQLATPTLLANPANRASPTAPTNEPNGRAITGANAGDDIVVTNVLSFQVRVLHGTNTDFQDLPVPPAGPASPRNFDTGNVGGIPLRVKAIQVTLRLYEPRNGLTRQSTIIVDQ